MRGCALRAVLLLREGEVGAVDDHVVPGVELEDIVAFFEVARAEGEGVGAFLVVGGVVGARGRNAEGCDGGGDAVGIVFGRLGWNGWVWCIGVVW